MADAVDIIGTIKEGQYIWIRSGPGESYDGISVLSPGDQIRITEFNGTWAKHEYGWTKYVTDDGRALIDLKDNRSDTKTVTSEENEKVVLSDAYGLITYDDGETETNYGYYSTSLDAYSPTYDDGSTAFIKSSRGIHGMPYQFMDSVDPRPDGGNFGKVYIDKILTRMPLLLLTPGRPKFLNGFSVKQKEDIVKYLTQKDDSVISDILERDGRYYDLEFNYKDYYDFVNPMCQQVATLLTMEDTTKYAIDGKPVKEFRWENWTNDAFSNFITSKECVAFYIDSETQISESFSNATGESQLASKVNALSDMGREIQFLLGEGAGVTFDKLAQENYDATLADFKSFSDKYLSFAPSSLMTKLTSGFLTVVEGGKMIFPEIWNDSQFSRSYSITIKLRTPDYDDFSWFMNIAVPWLHLLAFVAPQQMGPNSYKSPFLVRAFYKGFFNIDMGIITDMTITKGNQNKWTINGLPTEVDISFTIKDLYDVLTITKQSDIIKIMNNTALSDYLANMCGININRPDILRQLELYKQQIISSQGIYGRFNRSVVSLQNAIDNVLNNLYRNTLR